MMMDCAGDAGVGGFLGWRWKIVRGVVRRWMKGVGEGVEVGRGNKLEATWVYVVNAVVINKPKLLSKQGTVLLLSISLPRGIEGGGKQALTGSLEVGVVSLREFPGMRSA
jgi:hypothetical protein